jgi:hypothetical protein
MIQFNLTPAAGKRLIAKALINHPRVENTLKNGTIVIIAGTTNGYFAEELLGDDFSRKGFYRGLVLPSAKNPDPLNRLEDFTFPGDVVIRKGKWIKGETIFDEVDLLKEGDIIFKGANALNYLQKQVAVFVGHPQGGTIGASLPAVVGRRVELIIPVGLEKLVYQDLNQLAVKLNKPGNSGPRLIPVPGEIFTEIEAIELLSGAQAELIGSGGVAGAEGSVWLNISGGSEEITSALKILESVKKEPLYHL